MLGKQLEKTCRASALTWAKGISISFSQGDFDSSQDAAGAIWSPLLLQEPGGLGLGCPMPLAFLVFSHTPSLPGSLAPHPVQKQVPQSSAGLTPSSWRRDCSLQRKRNGMEQSSALGVLPFFLKHPHLLSHFPLEKYCILLTITMLCDGERGP